MQSLGEGIARGLRAHEAIARGWHEDHEKRIRTLEKQNGKRVA
jgi:hypothetical protein